MGKSFLLVSFIFSVLFSHAECYYSNYALKLDVTFSDNKDLICYAIISACDFNVDSVSDEGYLLNVLKKRKGLDSIVVYEQLLEYRYCISEPYCSHDERQSVFQLFEEVQFNKERVVQIAVLDWKVISALESISTKLSLNDTLMFTQKPLKVAFVEGYLCAHTVSVYNANPEVEQGLRELALINEEIMEWQADSNFQNGDAYDERLWEIIDRINKAGGVITVSSCTD